MEVGNSKIVFDYNDMQISIELPDDKWRKNNFFAKIESTTDMRVIIVMMMHSDKETMLFHSYLESRKAIARELDISEITVRNSIVRLVDSGLVLKIRRGIYKINPEYVRFLGKKIVKR